MTDPAARRVQVIPTQLPRDGEAAVDVNVTGDWAVPATLQHAIDG